MNSGNLASTTDVRERGAGIVLQNAGVKYRLLRESDRTLKGLLTGLISGGRSRLQEFWAVRGLDLQVGAGEVLGIVGANGSGKSTLLRAIAGILPLSEGSLAVEGSICPVLDASGVLSSHLTGRQNAEMFCALHRLVEARQPEWIREVEEFAELGSFFDVPMKTYSSGMAARLSFSLAVHLKPDILLIDEVLAVGDEYFQKKSHFRMSRMMQEGALVVLVSHDMAFLEKTATRVLAMEHGHAIFEGPPRETIRRYQRKMTER